MRNFKMPVPGYELVTRLGSGAQGTVWKAIREKDGKTVAIKVLSIHDDKAVDSAVNELDRLKALAVPECHPNIVCYHGVYIDEDNLKVYVDMEYIDGEDLDDYAKRLRDNEEYEKLYKHLLLITKDLIKGMMHFHDKKILHNDIKPGNIRIDSSLTPKFVDFGIACMAHDSCRLGSSTSPCCGGFTGTPSFVSPEMYKSSIRYPASDMWSLGMTLYDSATGSYPYDYSRKEPNLREAMQNITDVDPKQLNTTNSLLNKIVNKSLVREPADRITAQEINDLLKEYQ